VWKWREKAYCKISILDTLDEKAQRFEIELFAYVLMNNRYHLLHTPRANLSKAMQWFDRSGFEPIHKSAKS
jgi:REP element-mobilizing transposase RayT